MSSKIAIKERPNISLSVISSKLSRVFDASVASSITLGTGNNVTSWINIAPNATSGTDATQSVSANQPVYDSVNRRINFGSGISSRFLNFEGFGGTAFVGSIYIGTNAGVYAYNINVPSNANSSWEWGRFESNIFVTGIVITNQILTESEENIVNLWLGTKNSYGSVNFPSISVTNLSNRFRADYTSFYDYITTIKYVPNTTNVTDFYAVYWYCTSLTSFPSINTVVATLLDSAWGNCTSLTSFPLINTAATTNFQDTWYGCSSLTSFPTINTVAGTNFWRAWRNCSSLTSFPLINTAAGTNFQDTWYNCASLTQLSLDNILISLAAGLSNNPNKTVNANSTFAYVSTVPTNINRRPQSFSYTANLTSGSNIITIPGITPRNVLIAGMSVEGTGVLANTFITNIVGSNIELNNSIEVTNPNASITIKLDWQSWEKEADTVRFGVNSVALKDRIQTFGTGTNNEVIYNFNNGISGQQARLWMLARGVDFSVAAPGTPTLPTNSRVYRSNSGVTSNNWTPVSPSTNNQTLQTLINSPTTSTLHGLTNVLLGNGAGIQFNGLTAGDYTVYIGLARGYYKFTANGVGTTAKWGTELAAGTGVLSIVLFFGTPNSSQDFAIINWVNFYGSYNNLTVSDPYNNSGAQPQQIRQTSFT